jgi:hypothetical protein
LHAPLLDLLVEAPPVARGHAQRIMHLFDGHAAVLGLRLEQRQDRLVVVFRSQLSSRMQFGESK